MSLSLDSKQTFFKEGIRILFFNTYVVGTQKNRIIQTVILSTQNINFKQDGKEYINNFQKFYLKPIRPKENHALFPLTSLKVFGLVDR